MPDLRKEITALLGELSGGNRAIVDELVPLLYDELYNIAQRQLYGERSGHTLNATALLHEAYFKLVDQTRINWQNRAHFFAIASQAMRRILITHARKRNALKRGGGQIIATFDESALMREVRAAELISLDEALTELATFNERQSKVVEYRFFGGLKHEEIAEALGVSVPTVRLDWRLARAWLVGKIKDGT